MGISSLEFGLMTTIVRFSVMFGFNAFSLSQMTFLCSGAEVSLRWFLRISVKSFTGIFTRGISPGGARSAYISE